MYQLILVLDMLTYSSLTSFSAHHILGYNVYNFKYDSLDYTGNDLLTV